MTNQHTDDWTACILDKPLDQIPAYVETCIKASGGSDFYFVLGQREDGPVDICHVGNGPLAEAHARLIAAAPKLLATLRKLTFMARTSGGTAGPDTGLMDACADAETVLNGFPSPDPRGSNHEPRRGKVVQLLPQVRPL